MPKQDNYGYTRLEPGPNVSAPHSGSYGPGTERDQTGSQQMPNNHINNPWYYYGSQPIAALATAAEELSKSAVIFQCLPVVSELDKPPAGARNVAFNSYQRTMNI